MSRPKGACVKCVSRQDLVPCSGCAARLPEDLPLVHICLSCGKDPVSCVSFGSVDMSPSLQTFVCISCSRNNAAEMSKSVVSPFTVPTPDRFISLAEVHAPFMFVIMRAGPEAKRTALSVIKREFLDTETAIASALAGDVRKSQAITSLLAQQNDASSDPRVKSLSKGALEIFARQHMPCVISLLRIPFYDAPPPPPRPSLRSARVPAYREPAVFFWRGFLNLFSRTVCRPCASFGGGLTLKKGNADGFIREVQGYALPIPGRLHRTRLDAFPYV